MNDLIARWAKAAVLATLLLGACRRESALERADSAMAEVTDAGPVSDYVPPDLPRAVVLYSKALAADPNCLRAIDGLTEAQLYWAWSCEGSRRTLHARLASHYAEMALARLRTPMDRGIRYAELSEAAEAREEYRAAIDYLEESSRLCGSDPETRRKIVWLKGVASGGERILPIWSEPARAR